MKTILNYVNEKLTLCHYVNEKLALCHYVNEKLALNNQSRLRNIKKELSNINIKVTILSKYFDQKEKDIIKNVKQYISDNLLNINNVNTITITLSSNGSFIQTNFVFVRISINNDDPIIGKWILTDKDGNRNEGEWRWYFWTCVNNEKILKDDHDSEFKKQSHNNDGMIFIFNILDYLLQK